MSATYILRIKNKHRLIVFQQQTVKFSKYEFILVTFIKLNKLGDNLQQILI